MAYEQYVAILQREYNSAFSGDARLVAATAPRVITLHMSLRNHYIYHLTRRRASCLDVRVQRTRRCLMTLRDESTPRRQPGREDAQDE